MTTLLGSAESLAATRELIETAGARLPRELTEEERRRFHLAVEGAGRLAGDAAACHALICARRLRDLPRA